MTGGWGVFSVCMCSEFSIYNWGGSSEHALAQCFPFMKWGGGPSEHLLSVFL